MAKYDLKSSTKFDVDSTSFNRNKDKNTKKEPELPQNSPEFISNGVDEIQKACDDEESEIVDTWKKKREYEKKLFVQNTDSEFWICIGFQTRDQKNEFLSRTGIDSIGDKYLDGMEVAKILNIKLDSPIPPPPKFHIDKSWNRFVKPKK